MPRAVQPSPPSSTVAATWSPCNATTTSALTTPYTALSTKTSTRLLAERARSTPDAENLNTVGELLLLGGGVPLQFKGQVIGAIGVAGAGGAAFDEGCALAAINKVLPAVKH
jgi:uncharacterized protein GlcG (DUF336 family)